MARIYFEEWLAPSRFGDELALSSGSSVLVRRIGNSDIDNVRDEHAAECPNLLAGSRNGAAIVELLNLVTRAALGEGQVADGPDGERLTLTEISLVDKLRILDRACAATSRWRSGWIARPRLELGSALGLVELVESRGAGRGGGSGQAG